MKTIAKILTALATVVGAAYIIATYGEQIVAWCKKTLACLPKCPCCEEAAPEAAEETPAAEEAPVAEAPAEEPAAPEEPAEEPAPEVIVTENEPTAAEEDFAE